MEKKTNVAASYSKMFIPLTWLNFQVTKQPKSTLNSQQSGEVMGEAYFSVPKCPFFTVSIDRETLKYILSGQHCCFSALCWQQVKNHGNSPVGVPAAINLRWRVRWNGILLSLSEIICALCIVGWREGCFSRVIFPAGAEQYPRRQHFTQQAPLCTLSVFSFIYSLISTWTSAVTVKNGKRSRPIVFTRQDKSHTLGTQTSPLLLSAF